MDQTSTGVHTENPSLKYSLSSSSIFDSNPQSTESFVDETSNITGLAFSNALMEDFCNQKFMSCLKHYQCEKPSSTNEAEGFNSNVGAHFFIILLSMIWDPRSRIYCPPSIFIRLLLLLISMCPLIAYKYTN